MADVKRTRVADGKEEEGPVLRFRNYKPSTADLKADAVDTAILPAKEIEKKIEEETKAEIEKESTREVNIVPKKANWDLKRDVEKRLEKLNKETQKAIAALIKERLEAEESSSGGSESEDSGSDSDSEE